jgi:hypothetical protein
MVTRGKLTKEDLAYAAGLFDGEGHIIIYKDTNRKRGKTPVYILICGVTNTDKRIIDFFYNNWGACRQVRERKRDNPKWKTCYEWTIQARMAMNFLSNIYPYLIGKKEKAGMAIGFQGGMERVKDNKGLFRRIEKQEIERREKIWKKLNLHKK